MSVEDLRRQFEMLNDGLVQAAGKDKQLVGVINRHMEYLRKFVVEEFERQERARTFAIERQNKRPALSEPEPTSPRLRESADEYFMRLKAQGLTRMSSLGGQSMVPVRSTSETTTVSGADDSSAD